MIAFVMLAANLAAQSQANAPSLPQTASSPDPFAAALHLYRTGKFDAAEASYQALLRQNPKSSEAYAGLARTYLREQKVAQASALASQGMKDVPDSTTMHTALGEVYFRQGKILEAEEEFQRVLSSENNDARACWGLGRVFEARSLHAQAKKLLEKAHQIDPNDPDIQRDWMETLEAGKQIKALETYLSGETNDDAEERGILQRHLDLVKVLVKRPPMECELARAVPSAETEIRPILDGPQHLRGYGLDVKINGRSSRLLFDTGASRVLLGRKLAEKAGVERLSESEVRGVGDQGASSGYFGYAKSIQVGELEFHDCLVRVSEKKSVADEDGLVGADLFSHYLVTINFPKGRLRLSELPQRPEEKHPLSASAKDDLRDAPQGTNALGADAQIEAEAVASADSEPRDAYIAPEMQSYVPIFRFGHMLLLPTRVGDAAARLFLIDSGASNNTATMEAARAAINFLQTGRMQVSGLSGTVKDVYSADDAVLQFSHFRQEHQELLSFDLSHISKTLGTELSGTLGIKLLKTFVVHIDYRDGLVDFSRAK